MLENYRGIPQLMDTRIALTGLAVPLALSTIRRPGDVVPRIASLLLPATTGVGLSAPAEVSAGARPVVKVR